MPENLNHSHVYKDTTYLQWENFWRASRRPWVLKDLVTGLKKKTFSVYCGTRGQTDEVNWLRSNEKAVGEFGICEFLTISSVTELSFFWLETFHKYVQPANLGLLRLKSASSMLGMYYLTGSGGLLVLVLWILWNLSCETLSSKETTRLLVWHCLGSCKEAIPSAKCCPALEKWDSLQRHSHSLLLDYPSPHLPHPEVLSPVGHWYAGHRARSM